MNRLIVLGLALWVVPVLAADDTDRKTGGAQPQNSLEALRTKLYESALAARDLKQIGETLQEHPNLLPDSSQLVADIRAHLTIAARDLQALRSQVEALRNNVESQRAQRERMSEADASSAPDITSTLEQGQRALQAGELDEASFAFRAALDVAPDSAEARLGLAACHFESGASIAARDLVDEVLAADPRNPKALGLDGALLFRQGDYSSARRTLQRALKIDDTNANNHNYLGVVLQAQNRTSAAITSVRRAVELDPDYLGARYNLAVLLATARPPELEAAREEYEQFLRMGGDRNPAMEQILRTP